MRRNKFLAVFFAGCLVLSLCACADTNNQTQTKDPDTTSSEPAAEVQYDYQLKAGETAEVYDVTFDQMVTVTVDPESTRDASVDLRSNIFFDNCTFNGGLTIVGDYHAMVNLGAGCVFGDDSIVTCKEATAGAAKDTVLDDNLVKVFVSCEGVCIETESAMGVITDSADFVFNGTSYSKNEIAPDIAYLGVYSIYEGDTITYPKLGIGEDDSITVLD